MSHLGVIHRHSSYKQFTQDNADDEIHMLIVLVLFEAPLQVACVHPLPLSVRVKAPLS